MPSISYLDNVWAISKGVSLIAESLARTWQILAETGLKLPGRKYGVERTNLAETWQKPGENLGKAGGTRRVVLP